MSSVDPLITTASSGLTPTLSKPGSMPQTDKEAPVAADGFAPSGIDASQAARLERFKQTSSSIFQAGAPGGKGISTGAAAQIMAAGEMPCKKLWEFPTGGPVQSSPKISPDGSVIAGSDDGSLYAIKDGKKAWEFKTGGPVRSGAAFAADGSVVIGSNDGNVYGLKNGHKEWNISTGRAYEATPAIGPDGTVYAGCQNGYITMIKDKENVFGIYIDDWSTNPVIGPDNTIYVNTHGGVLRALKYGRKMISYKQYAKELWSLKTGDGLSHSNSSPVLGPDGTIYITGTTFGKGEIFAVSKGKTRWQMEMNDSLVGSPCLGPDGTIYAGGKSGKIYAVKEGVKKWEFQTGGAISTAPAIGPDGTIYVGTEKGSVYALKDGQKSWEFQTGGAIHTDPAVDSKGIVYVGSDDGKIYALTAQTTEEQVQDETAAQEQNKPAVDTIDEWVVVDGVKIPVKKQG
jgi:outer membrane protein assembly factor BamB